MCRSMAVLPAKAGIQVFPPIPGFRVVLAIAMPARNDTIRPKPNS